MAERKEEIKISEPKVIADKAKGWWWTTTMTVFGAVLLYGIIIELRQSPPPKIAEVEKEKKEVVIVLSLKLKGFDTPAKIRMEKLPRIAAGEKFVFEGPPETRVQFVGPSRFNKKPVVVREGNIKTSFGKIPKGAKEIFFFGPAWKEIMILKKPLSSG